MIALVQGFLCFASAASAQTISSALEGDIGGDSEISESALDAPFQDRDDFGVDWPEFDDSFDNPTAKQQGEEAAQRDRFPGGILPQDVDGEETRQADGVGLPESVVTAPVAPALPPDSRVGDPLSGDIAGYDVVVRFDDDALARRDRLELLQRFKALSALEQLSADDSNIAQLRRRANRDQALLLRLLRIYGHYDGIVVPRFGTLPDDSLIQSTNDDVSVSFLVTAGPLYRLRTIDLGMLKDTKADFPFFQDAFGLTVEDPVSSDLIVAGEARLTSALAENGYAFAAIASPDLVIDHQARAGDLALLLDPGAKYSFGDIIVDTDPLLSARHLSRIARFDRGDVFRESRIEDLRRAILATGLVASVTITPVEGVDGGPSPNPTDGRSAKSGEAGQRAPAPAEKTVDLNVEIAPAPLRTIAGELGFGTGEGFRVAASWEHRNFFPPEGLFRVRGVVGTQEQLLGATYRRNNFRDRDTVLSVNALLANVERDAFDARTISLSAAIQRQTNLIFQKKWTWSAGAEFILTDESDIAGPNANGRETFGIAALPLSLAYDDSDDLLNPSKGFRIAVFASPEVSLITGNVAYLRTQFDASFYQPVNNSITLAGRTRLAGTSGADTFQIAPSRRFYSGGGGSVRGFGFQDIGPIDLNGDPVGGRSLAEFSLEARVRFGDFGVVPFVDAGNVYDESLPGFGGLRYGAGIGLRYYSSFGPLRLDVGTPINPGPNDSAIGVYVSLGQAF